MAYGTLITAERLRARLPHRELVIVDARFDLADTGAGRGAYAQGHLPGAVYVHLDIDLSGPVTANSGRHPLPDLQQFARNASAWGIGAQSQVVVYDDGPGVIAARVWWLMRWLGHADVAVLDGGLPAWLHEGGRLSTERRAPPLYQLDPRAPLALPISVEEVACGIRQGTLLLVDARAGPRFRGETEPLDKVAGHVPGAVNMPFDANLREDGRWLEANILRAHWQRFLAGHSPRQVASMCGSGVTACQNLLAMEHAGLSGARLYAGSWSEWIRDPLRAVATGDSPRPIM